MLAAVPSCEIEMYLYQNLFRRRFTERAIFGAIEYSTNANYIRTTLFSPQKSFGVELSILCSWLISSTMLYSLVMKLRARGIKTEYKLKDTCGTMTGAY